MQGSALGGVSLGMGSAHLGQSSTGTFTAVAAVVVVGYAAAAAAAAAAAVVVAAVIVGAVAAAFSVCLDVDHYESPEKVDSLTSKYTKKLCPRLQVHVFAKCPRSRPSPQTS